MNDKMVLKLRIRELRQARGMKLNELAARIGISIPHLSEVERGKKNLNNHLIERISTELGVAPPELFGAPVTELDRAMESLDKAGHARVLGFAQGLAAETKVNEQNK